MILFFPVITIPGRVYRLAILTAHAAIRAGIAAFFGNAATAEASKTAKYQRTLRKVEWLAKRTPHSAFSGLLLLCLTTTCWGGPCWYCI